MNILKVVNSKKFFAEYISCGTSVRRNDAPLLNYSLVQKINKWATNFITTLCLCFFGLMGYAQNKPNVVYANNIHSVRLHVYGDQEGMPIYKLKSNDRLELHFDDFEGNVRSYYYTYQLCDYNWQPISISQFDYIKGFTQQRITNYRFSSIAFTRYTHYQVIFPDDNSMPSRSGNYLLKVYLDGDTSKTVFTRGLIVLDAKASVSAQVVQPFSPQVYQTHQRIKFNINVQGLNFFDANRQIKVAVLQNNRWDNAQGEGIMPTFVRGTNLEYNTENNFVFPGGKEWRWLDLRSFRLLSDRIDHADNKKTSIDLYVKSETDRNGQRYVYYKDLDGQYLSTTYETINPYWQADYATVHFTFSPPGSMEYKNKSLYLFGQLTDYTINDVSKMTFNSEKNVYEGSLLLKQGYYDYSYMLVDNTEPQNKTLLEGNNWEAQNTYTVLVYYKSFTDQADQIIGVARVSSRLDRPGISF